MPFLSLVGQSKALKAGYIGTGTAIAMLDLDVDQLRGPSVTLSEKDFGGCTDYGVPECCRIVEKVVLAPDFCKYCSVGSECNGTHGTYVAQRIAQTAPGVDIIAIDVFHTHRTLDDIYCGAEDQDIVDAIDWIIEHQEQYNIVAVNLSLSEEESPYNSSTCPIITALNVAIEEASSYGIAIIAASGNMGYSNGIGHPACHPKVISVGSVFDDAVVIDVRHSNSSAELDLLAPSDYGTSFAAPVVSGAWAIMKAARPDLDNEDILNLFKETGIQIQHPESSLFFPLIQLDKALGIEPESPDRSESNDKFGSSLASDDFNGDGFMDIAVGSPGERNWADDKVGAVNIYFGSAHLNPQEMDQIIYPGMNSKLKLKINSNFGSVLTTGDYNGDGFSDLVVAAPDQKFYFPGEPEYYQGGSIYVFYGSENGFNSFDLKIQEINQNMPEVPGTPKPHPNQPGPDKFGAALASGNFNNDAYMDLAIGVPNENELDIGAFPYSGIVHIFYGSSTGLSMHNNQLWHEDVPGIHGKGEEGDQFGSSLAVGDFNSDYYDDLAIGVPGESIGDKEDAGMVIVIYGSSSGLTATGTQRFYQDLFVVGNYHSEAGDKFGFSLATGDFDGNSADDLAIGVPGEDLDRVSSTGLVHVIFGCPPISPYTGSSPLCNPGLSYGQIKSNEQVRKRNYSYFGITLSSGNFDNDQFYGVCSCPSGLCGCTLNYDDLVVGAYGDSPPFAAGSIYVYYGAWPNPLTYGQFWNQDSEGLNFSPEAEDLFGYSITCNDFNRDYFDDIVIGIPGKNVDSPIYETRPGCAGNPVARLDNAGIAEVIFGSEEGLYIQTSFCYPDPCPELPDGAKQAKTLSQGR